MSDRDTLADLIALILLAIFLAFLLFSRGIPLNPTSPAPRAFGDSQFHPAAGPWSASVPRKQK